MLRFKKSIWIRWLARRFWNLGAGPHRFRAEFSKYKLSKHHWDSLDDVRITIFRWKFFICMKTGSNTSDIDSSNPRTINTRWNAPLGSFVAVYKDDAEEYYRWIRCHLKCSSTILLWHFPLFWIKSENPISCTWTSTVLFSFTSNKAQ